MSRRASIRDDGLANFIAIRDGGWYCHYCGGLLARIQQGEIIVPEETTLNDRIASDLLSQRCDLDLDSLYRIEVNAGVLCEAFIGLNIGVNDYASMHDLITDIVANRYTLDGDLQAPLSKYFTWRHRGYAWAGSIDHIDPEGGDDVDNLVLACRRCNSRKGHSKDHPAKKHDNLISGLMDADEDQFSRLNARRDFESSIEQSLSTDPNPYKWLEWRRRKGIAK